MNNSAYLKIFQIIVLYNAMKNGWDVKKVGKNIYELKKRNENVFDFNLKKFIDKITIEPIDYRNISKIANK